METIKTYLPVFPGFYGTLFEADETQEIDHINELREVANMEPVKFDDIKFDYKTFEKESAMQAVNFIEKELNEVLDTNFVITFEELISPREYNFTNDSINVEIKGTAQDFEAVQNYINNNFAAFNKYIKERYSSCSGFISFYTNEGAEFLALSIEEDNHIFGSLLDFIFENEKIDQEQMYYYVVERVNINAENYNELTGNN